MMTRAPLAGETWSRRDFLRGDSARLVKTLPDARSEVRLYPFDPLAEGRADLGTTQDRECLWPGIQPVRAGLDVLQWTDDFC